MQQDEQFIPFEKDRNISSPIELSDLNSLVGQHSRDIAQQQQLNNLILAIMTGIVIALFLAFAGYFADLIKLHTESYQAFTNALQSLHK